MCGITGIFSFTNSAKSFSEAISKSLATLTKRGPDAQQVFFDDSVYFGHARLSIIDTSAAGNQPFTDKSGRYTIVYNGEFYNYRNFYDELRADGYTFNSSSDTEVLLYLYIKYKHACVEKIHGFFAFAIYDSIEKTVFIARDRIGIKPLYYIHHDSFFCFSSELTATLPFPFQKNINFAALQSYLQLHYIPAPYSMLEGVHKLLPGHSIFIQNNSVSISRYYRIPEYSKVHATNLSYLDAQKELRRLLHASVQQRLISDVPLGTFLSGGIDSSVISTIAAQYTSQLKTFSIGFPDNPYFDETHYAQLVAQNIQSDHTVISIGNKEFEEHMFSVLDSFDEPFADSSAIAVSVLSKYVKPHVTVALSGDGADELFAGYNKYAAHSMMFKHPMLNKCISAAHPIISVLPQSRNSAIGNAIRKIERYARACNVCPRDVYIQWCSMHAPDDVKKMMREQVYESADLSAYTSHFSHKGSMQDILYADQHLVLANDMLTKVDRMSMQHSLEVRVPFLDHSIVSFANSLPEHYKINNKLKKSILQDAFRDDLPKELYNRPKKGFEVPLHDWCTSVLQDTIHSVLSNDFITQQNIFNPTHIAALRSKLSSRNPGDSAAHIWALLVFQIWWKKHIQHA